MAVPTSLSPSKLHLRSHSKRTQLPFQYTPPKFLCFSRQSSHFEQSIITDSSQNLKFSATVLGVSGLAFVSLIVGPASASELSIVGTSFQFSEPSNALSLPTWAIHVSSVVEWVTAMALVWQYGEKSGNESWKGLSWGMVLVALQAALTVIGNATMCFAAFRIYRFSQEQSKNL